MKINNSGTANTFKARYIVVGKSTTKQGNITEISKKAVEEASMVWEIVEKHCKKANIPFVVDNCYKAPKKSPLAEDIISYSFLTGEDALKFRESPLGVFFHPIESFKLLKKNIVDAAEALKAINKNLFDFENGTIKNESTINDLELGV